MDVDSKKCQNSIKPQTEKEGELIGMLSKQLYLAGDQMQRMQAVLKKAENRVKSKDQEISRLKRKMKDWETKNKIQSTTVQKKDTQRQDPKEKSDYIYRRCLNLEHKIYEMEKFLADYGLVWIGNKGKRAQSVDTMSNNFINSCFVRLVANIEELNLSVGKGEMHICHNQGGASFKAPSCMTLKFYKNGMIVHKDRLRSYKNPATRSFIQDILDGYFPSELQRQYPNGVPFKVEDHRTETYLGDGVDYPGHGYQLGKLSSNGQIRPATSAGILKNCPSRSSTERIHWDSKSLSVKTSCSRHRLSTPVSSRAKIISSSARLPSSDQLDLRSQILASHNNNCSDTHLKSHMNAEIVLSARTDKLASVTKHGEFHVPVRERLSNLKCNGSKSISPSTKRRCDAIDRPPTSALPSSDVVESDIATRLKSVSLSQSRYQFKPFPSLSFADSNVTTKACTNDCGEKKHGKLRATRSVTMGKYNTEMPILEEINKSTGQPGELRLKVRSMTGSTVYLVHISADDTVARLYQLLDRVLRTRHAHSVDYKIIVSGYTPKRLDHLNVLLRDYGINRDSVLHLVND